MGCSGLLKSLVKMDLPRETLAILGVLCVHRSFLQKKQVP